MRRPDVAVPVRAKRPLLLTIIFSTGLPITAFMIPVYSLFVQVNLIDSMLGAILFLGASALPYAIFLTKGFMDGVPVEIEESACCTCSWAATSARASPLRAGWRDDSRAAAQRVEEVRTDRSFESLS